MKGIYPKLSRNSKIIHDVLLQSLVLSLRQIMRDSWFVTVQNSQFPIHIRFANNTNGHIRRICTHRLIFVSIRWRSSFLTKSKDANHHESHNRLAPASNVNE